MLNSSTAKTLYRSSVAMFGSSKFSALTSGVR